MKVNLSQKFFYNRELFKPANNPVDLPEEAVEDISDNDVIIEGSAGVKKRFEELKAERLEARSFQSKDAVGKLTHRLDVLEDRKPSGGKDHSKEVDSLNKRLADLAELVEELKEQVEAVRKDSAATAPAELAKEGKENLPASKLPPENQPPLEPPLPPTGSTSPKTSKPTL